MGDAGGDKLDDHQDAEGKGGEARRAARTARVRLAG